MPRRRRDNDSSLELLLDTITNTFGGILFIAILVSLMLRTSSRHVQESASAGEAMSAVEQVELEIRIDDLRQDVENLRQKMASTPKPGASLADESAVGRLAAAAAALAEALGSRAAAAASTLELQREAAEANKVCDDIAEARESVEKRFAQAQESLAAARDEAAKLAAAAVELERPSGEAQLEQTVSLPSLRPSIKDEVGLYVRFDRIFMMHKWRDGTRLGPNTDQFVVTTDGDMPVARPKPSAGLQVDAASVATDVGRLLQPFPPARFVVGLLVFEDSFDVFQLVKAAIVRAGYEYRPIAMRPGDSVTDSGGRGEAQ